MAGLRSWASGTNQRARIGLFLQLDQRNLQIREGLETPIRILAQAAFDDALDLGIGSDEYKRLFCKGDEPIFDCYIPLSSRGRIAALAMSGYNRIKRLVKHNAILLGLAQRLRRAFH